MFWFSQRFNERSKTKDVKRKVYRKCQLRAEEISALQEDTWSFPIERESKEYISEQDNLDREMAIAQYANFLIQSDNELNLAQRNFVKYFFTFNNSSFGQWGPFKSILKKLEQRTDLTELLALGYLSLPIYLLGRKYDYYWREAPTFTISRGDLMLMYLNLEYWTEQLRSQEDFKILQTKLEAEHEAEPSSLFLVLLPILLLTLII